MKVEVKEVEKEGFKPFKIEITIETLEEHEEVKEMLSSATILYDLYEAVCEKY